MVCAGVIRLVAICACCAVAVNSLKKNEATAEQLADMPEHEKLMYFAGRNKLEELIKAVAGGADLFDKAKAESRGHTALDTVLTKCFGQDCEDVAVLQYIVEQYAKAGENINRQDFKRRTGIYNACRLGHIASLRLMLEHEGDPTIKAEDAQCANGRCNCLEIALAKRKGKFGGHPTVATVLLESSWREQLIADTKDSFAKEALKKLLVMELKTLEEEKKAEEPEPASASPAAKSKEEPERSDPNSPKTALERLLTEKVAELKNKMAKQEKAIEAWKSKFKSCQNNMNFNIRAAAQRADKDL